MATFLRKQWRRKPPESWQINWGHPLADGLIGAFVPRGLSLVNACNGEIGAVIGTRPVATGDGFTFSNGGFYFSHCGLKDCNSPWSIISEARWSGNTGVTWSALFSINKDVAFYVPRADTSPKYCYLDNLDGTGKSASGVVDTTLATYTLTCRGKNNYLIYKNAIPESSEISTGSDSTYTDGLPVYIGYGQYSYTVFQGDISYLWLFQKRIDADCVALLTENPWQLFQPRRIIFDVGATQPGVTVDPAGFVFSLPIPDVPVAPQGISRLWSAQRLIPVGCDFQACHLSPVGRDIPAHHRVPVGRDLAVRHLSPGVVADFAAAHTVAGWVRRTFTAVHALPVPVAGTFHARHAVLDVNPVARQWSARHEVPSDTAIFRPASWSAVFDDDGSALDLIGATITGDRESYAWSVDLTLPDAEAWADCTPGRRLTLTVSGQPFALLLESRNRNRSATSAEWTATARTVSCLLGEPYADALSQSWPKITASAAAVGLAALVGLPLSWEVCDWTLPAGRLTADAETPASVLSRLAQSCGAMVQPDPAGGVVVRYRYPVGVTEYADATPRAILTAADAVLTLSETYSAQPGYDAVTVVDNRVDTDSYLTWELDDDRNASRTTFPPGEPCYFRVYHNVGYTVRASSGRLERVAVDEEASLTGTVGFDDADTADLDKLVLAVDAVVWWGADLGAVTPNGGAGVLLPGGAGFSVAEITYRTRYDVWKLVPEALGETFPVMLELAEADA